MYNKNLRKEEKWMQEKKQVKSDKPIEEYLDLFLHMINEHDEVKIMIIKKELLKILKKFQKEVSVDFLLAHFFQIYYKIFHYTLNQEVNRNNIALLLTEKKILHILKTNYSRFEKTEKEKNFIQIFYDVSKIDMLRIKYIKDNDQKERTMPSNRYLLAAQQIMNENMVLKKELKKDLPTKEV